MESIGNIQQTLTELLLEDIELCLDRLKELIPFQNKKYENILLINGQLQDLENDQINGIITIDEANVRRNKVRVSLIAFINSLTEADFSKNTNSTTGTTPQQKGKLFYRIPDTMQINKQVLCNVRIAFDETTLLTDLAPEADDTIQDLKNISNTMAVELMDISGQSAFKIIRTSDEIQIVDKSNFTGWNFLVTPLLAGEHQLLLKISVLEKIDEIIQRRNVEVFEKVTITIGAPASDNVPVPEKTSEQAFMMFNTATTSSTVSVAANYEVSPSSWYKRPMSLMIALLIFSIASGIGYHIWNQYFRNNTPNPIEQKDPTSKDNPIDIPDTNMVIDTEPKSQTKHSNIKKAAEFRQSLSKQLTAIERLLKELKLTLPNQSSDSIDISNTFAKRFDEINQISNSDNFAVESDSSYTEIAQLIQEIIDDIDDTTENLDSTKRKDITIATTSLEETLIDNLPIDSKYQHLLNVALRKKSKGKGLAALAKFEKALKYHNGKEAKLSRDSLLKYKTALHTGNNFTTEGNCDTALIHYQNALNILSNGREVIAAMKSCSNYNDILAKGDVLYKQRKGADAFKEYTNALALVKKGIIADRKIKQLKPYITQLEEAKKYIATGEIDKAENNISTALNNFANGNQAKAIEKKIEKHNAHIKSGNNHIDNENCNAAIAEYDKAIRVFGQSQPAQNRKSAIHNYCHSVQEGMVHLLNKHPQLAKESFRNATSSHNGRQARKGIELADNPLTTVAQLRNSKDYIIFKSKRMPDGQIWMIENLNTPYIAGSWCYDNQTANCDTGGRLYSWKAAQTACPKGWHLPSDEEWKALALSIGGLSFWFPKPSTIESPETAFNFLQKETDLEFAGIYYKGSTGKEQNLVSNYWTSTSIEIEGKKTDAYYYGLSTKNGKLFRSFAIQDEGRSCLCIKNGS